MREIRTSGSEGGEANNLPDPYHEFAAVSSVSEP
jgi:hypothetical protein